MLAAVFVLAAAVKLRSIDTVAAEFAAMHLRRSASVARLVPALELGVAAALAITGWPGAVAALGLLVAFTVVIVRLVQSGSKATCACFGAVDQRPVSWWQVARNLLLIGLALWGCVAGPPTDLRLRDLAVVVGVSGAGAAALVVARRAAAARDNVPGRPT